MAEAERTTGGLARLQLQGLDGRWMTVSAFKDFTEAQRFGEALLKRRPLVLAVRVEHRNGRVWKPVTTLTPPARRA